jgi:hypothetical protein
MSSMFKSANSMRELAREEMSLGSLESLTMLLLLSMGCCWSRCCFLEGLSST